MKNRLLSTHQADDCRLLYLRHKHTHMHRHTSTHILSLWCGVLLTLTLSLQRGDRIQHTHTHTRVVCSSILSLCSFLLLPSWGHPPESVLLSRLRNHLRIDWPIIPVTSSPDLLNNVCDAHRVYFRDQSSGGPTLSRNLRNQPAHGEDVLLPRRTSLYQL